MDHSYNFFSGPTQLPQEVTKRLQAALASYKNTGLSISEISHLSSEFQTLKNETEASLRTLLNVPDNYKIMLMQGSSSLQYSAIPMNFLKNPQDKADYIISGVSSNKAFKEARKVADAQIVASSICAGFSFVPATTKETFHKEAKYIYFSYNNSFAGTRFPSIPDVGNIPLVADVSSVLGSETIDISKYALVFASCQENFGIVGMTIVIIREDFLATANEDAPAILNYSLFNQPSSISSVLPSINLFLLNQMIGWIIEHGGVEAMEADCLEKSKLLYDYLDHQNYYILSADKPSRSRNSVTFRTKSVELDKKFILEASQAGLKNVDGYPSIGGMHIGIYNSLPREGIEKLLSFMKGFASNNPIID